MAWIDIPRRMKDWSLWALWWLLLGAAVLWLLVGSVAYWVKEDWLPAEAAGWVQAIGSIVAIAVAVGIPIYLRVQEHKERLSDKAERDIARTEQLLALCIEGLEVINDFDDEMVFADYDTNNALRRAVLEDLLSRLNEAQKAELNAERMRVGMKFRSCIYDWIKYFGGQEVTDLGRLHDRVNLGAVRLERVKIDADNILRRQQGLPLLELPRPKEHDDDDVPF